MDTVSPVNKNVFPQGFAEAAIHALSAHICVVDENGVIVAVNQAWREFARANAPAPATDYLGENYLAVCDRAVGESAAGAADFATGIRAVLMGQMERYEQEYPCHSPQEKRWFIGRVTRLADVSPLHLVIAHENITARKQAENQLDESQRHLSALMGNLPGMVYRCRNDADWRMEFVSEGCRAITGYPAQALIENAQITYASLIHPADRQMVWDGVQKALAERMPYQLIYRIITASGTEKWAWEHGSGVYSLIGNLQALEGLIMDVTDLKHAEQALRVSMQQIETADLALKRRAAQLALLNDVGGQITAELDIDRLLDRAAALVHQHFGYHHVGLFLLNPGRSALVMRAKAGKFMHLFPAGHQLSLKQGMVGWVCQHGKSLLENDVASAPTYVNLLPDSIPTQSELSVPIQINGIILGVLDIQSPERDDFDENDVLVMETLANQIAVALENARLFQAARQELAERRHAEATLLRTNQRLTSLREIDHALLQTGKTGHPPEVEALRRLSQLVPCEEINLLVFDDAQQQATRIAHFEKGQLQPSIAKTVVGYTDLITGTEPHPKALVKELTPETLANAHQQEHHAQGRRSLAHIPLAVQGKLIGLLALLDNQSHFFTPEYVEIASDVADQIAISLYQTALLKQITQHAGELELRVEERTQELLQSEVIYRTLFENANDAIFLMDTQRKFIRVNPRACQLLGYTPEELIGHEAHEFIVPEQLSEAQNRVAALLAGETVPVYGRQFRTRSGLIVETDISLSLINDETGQPKFIQSVVRDVNERKQAEQLRQQSEEALRLSNAEMTRALRMKDEFLATMSHELRTPLSAILGISESLEEQIFGQLNEKQAKYIRTISESGRHLLSLINDILDLSKIEAGRMTLDWDQTTVEPLCQASLRMVKELALKKNLTLSFKSDGQVDSLRMDERRIKQSLVNLLSNAVKFTPEGGRVGLEVRGDVEAQQAILTVWDTGIGIEEELLPMLFQPFVQLDGGLARQHSGTGLGLVLVSRMVGLHSGEVRVESTPGQGSRFSICLPWNLNQPSQAYIAQPSISSSAFNPAGNAQERILLVEDTDTVELVITDYLQALGYQVFNARNGLAALAMLDEIHPHLVLMDVQMPDMDGLEVTRRIRTERDLPHLPIIAMTALAMPGDRERCLLAGMDDYISKPVSLRELAALIRMHLPESDHEANT